MKKIRHRPTQDLVHPPAYSGEERLKWQQSKITGSGISETIYQGERICIWILNLGFKMKLLHIFRPKLSISLSLLFFSSQLFRCSSALWKGGVL